jgi:acylphosphatase
VASCLHGTVIGRVQGVGFRWCTREKALELGLSGWVRNRRDGNVEVWIEGEDADVRAMGDWLRRGPPHASVERIALDAAEPAGHREFEVRPTAR